MTEYWHEVFRIIKDMFSMLDISFRAIFSPEVMAGIIMTVIIFGVALLGGWVLSSIFELLFVRRK